MKVDGEPVGLLRIEPEQINPAIILAEKLMRRNGEELLTVGETNEAETILNIGTREIETIESHRKAFLKSPSTASSVVPVGF